MSRNVLQKDEIIPQTDSFFGQIVLFYEVKKLELCWGRRGVRTSKGSMFRNKIIEIFLSLPSMSTSKLPGIRANLSNTENNISPKIRIDEITE